MTSGPQTRNTAEIREDSTLGLAERDKFPFWKELIAQNLVDLDYSLAQSCTFDATFRAIKANGLSFSSISAPAHIANRTSNCVSSRSEDALVFNFVHSGILVAEQGGRRTVIKPGEAVACDASRVYSLQFPATVSIFSIRVTHRVIRQNATHLDRATAINFSHAGTVCPLAFDYLRRLMEQIPAMSTETPQRVTQNFSELLGTMINEVVEKTPFHRSEYRSTTLLRIKRFIEQHLSEPDFGTENVTTQMRLSMRYINQLFETEETSLSRYIWQRRLERCASDLRNPALHGRSISEIALSNGFNDLSHFSKAFHRRWGIAPRQYRQQENSKGI